MARSEARKRANKKWNAANADRYERIALHAYAGTKAKIAAAASAAGENISRYMIEATFDRMRREGYVVDDNGNGDNDNGTR